MEKKIRVCVYLTKEEKQMLDELLIKKIREGETPRITTIFTEALEVFYEQELSI